MTFISTDVPFVAIATLACVLMIGLGFLPRPSKATAMWAIAFTLAMLASYALLAASMLDSDRLRAVGSGIFLPAVAFLWIGLRDTTRRTRLLWPIAVGYLIASPVALAVALDTSTYSAVFRIDFAIAAAFAVCALVELARLRGEYSELVLPMVIASALFPVFAVFALVDGLLQAMHDQAPSLDTVRDVNGVATGVYVVCALVTLLLIARGPRAGRRLDLDGSFDAVARRRLVRARAASDVWWSLIEVRLDDPRDLRTALGSDPFDRVVTRFRSAIFAELPADADIDQVDDTRFIALLPRSQEAVRQIITSLLERISAPDSDQALPVRISASIGWAPVEKAGFDLDVLRSHASCACDSARDRGGDRWERLADDVAPARA